MAEVTVAITLDPAVLFTCADPSAPRSSPSRLRRITDDELTRATVDAPGLSQNPLAPPSGLPYPTYSEGVGMDARQQARAFDDFFTTKASGMGLGLAFVRRVAHAHGGQVSLSSRIGRGTLVRVTIPAKDA